MRQKIITVSLFAVFAVSAFAQVAAQSDRFLWHGGFMYEFIRIAPKIGPAPDDPYLSYYGITFGTNYAIVHSNDQVSLSANPNVALAYSGFGGTNFLAQAPMYLLARYGAGATKYNEQKVGVGAGIGVNYTFLYINSGGTELNQGFANPSAIVELNLNNRSSFYSIRAHWSLMRAEQRIDLFGMYEFSTFGLALSYSF